MITVVRAPAYLTVQDSGRKSMLSAGVPRGGAMDSFALAAANSVAGNDPNAAALEWALTAGAIRFDQDRNFAFAGATPDISIAGRDIPPLTRVAARAGDLLEVGPLTARRFLYLAVEGGIDVPAILDSRSTYLPAALGGYQGRILRTGDKLTVGPATGSRGEFRCPPELLPRYDTLDIRITRGPQANCFGDESWRTLLTAEYRISRSSDRTGYRLEGQPLGHSLGTLPSEAGCPGAIQIPLDGNPIVLMADAPTVGGYPKIAVVAQADLPILAQKKPGDSVRFNLVTIEESQRALRRVAADLAMLRDRGQAAHSRQ